MKDRKDPNEIEALNEGLITFDLDDVSAEALEQRLEMAVATLFDPNTYWCLSNSCADFSGTCLLNSCSVDRPLG
jgi:hypothetical protein